MNSLLRFLAVILLVAIISLGCSARPLNVSYYQLTSIEQSRGHDLKPLGQYDIALGVGPVTVSESLKKSRIATRLDSQRYYYHEQHRWAGLVEEDISSILEDNLGYLLGTDRIMTYPWQSFFKPDYRVSVKIIKLDGVLNQEARLSARWSISDKSGGHLLHAGKSDLSQLVEAPGYQALVAAESRLLGDFCYELARKVVALDAL